jgi:hypothetical protein
VESTLGIISAVFRVWQKLQLLQFHKATETTLACVVSHDCFVVHQVSFDSDDTDKGRLIPGLRGTEQLHLKSTVL